MIENLEVIGYLLNGTLFLLLTMLLATNWRGRLRSRLLMLATFVSAIWSFLFASMGSLGNEGAISFSALFLLELARSGTWVIFVAVLFRDLTQGGGASVYRRYSLVGVSSFLALSSMVGIVDYFSWVVLENSSLLVLILLVTASTGLLMLEQIYRNAFQSAKSVLKYLFIGIGIIFAYDMFLYSSSVIQGQISPTFWGLRGFFFLMSAPLIAVAAQRMPDWSTNIFVSRQVVFYSTTLVGLGLYLVALAAVGQFLRVVGGTWGALAQIGFLAFGLVLITTLMLSDRRRAKFRVFIDKHFFRNKYDYRLEWLRLIRTLTGDGEKVSLRERCISALGRIVGSSSGALWLATENDSDLVPAAAWGMELPGKEIAADESLVTFLQTTQWVIDIAEYQSNPAHYEPLGLDVTRFEMSRPGFIIPLFHSSRLLGLVVLSDSVSGGNLNYEDHDLLRTSGSQIASYLSQEFLTEELARNQQFQAYNKLTAFLMHDLKNVLAQQTLLLENAERHRGNPEFIDDVLMTIDNSVRRIRNVLDHITQQVSKVKNVRVDLQKALLQAVSVCSIRQPAPYLKGNIVGSILVDEDKFQTSLIHLIRNAQDATDESGQVQVLVEVGPTKCTVTIEDTGLGMDDEFIRTRLFRPFDSTKGAQGMGIGAYQAREFIRSCGGDIRVSSEPGVGTRISVCLPLANEQTVGRV